MLLFQVSTDHCTVTYMCFIYQANICTQCDFCHTCFSSCISNIREYKIILYKMIMYMFSVALCLVYTWAAFPNDDTYYTHVLYIICIWYRPDNGPYFIIECIGNVTELPISISCCVFICSNVESQHNLHILGKVGVRFSQNIFMQMASTFLSHM